MKDKLYYELLGRISELENRMNKLENDLKNKKSNYNNSNSNFIIKESKSNFTYITKESKKELIDVEETKLTKDKVISDLTEKVRHLGITINKGNKTEGLGIITTYNGIKLNVMLRTSRDYSKGYSWEDKYELSGWSTIRLDKIEMFDAYLFVVYKQVNIYYFVLSKGEMNEMLKQKVPDKNGSYHFYFARNFEGHFYEHREDKVIFDANKYYNNWDVLKSLANK